MAGAIVPFMVDASNEKNAHIQNRLEEASIIWMTTVTPAGQPQSAPVWYVWQDGEFLVYSLNSARVRNIRTNAKVSLHLSDKGNGDEIVVAYGLAKTDPGAGPASANTAYTERYNTALTNYQWTWEYFDSTYKAPLRIKPDRFLSW